MLKGSRKPHNQTHISFNDIKKIYKESSVFIQNNENAKEPSIEIPEFLHRKGKF